jgi:dihydroorotase
VLDATGFVIAPGFVDLARAFARAGWRGRRDDRDPECEAAAAGGFTTIFCMPNTKPVCDSTTGVQYILSRAAATCAKIRVVPVGCVTRGQMGEDLS